MERKIPSDTVVRKMFRDHPNWADQDFADEWGCTRQAVALVRDRLGIPTLAERRAFNSGEAT